MAEDGKVVLERNGQWRSFDPETARKLVESGQAKPVSADRLARFEAATDNENAPGILETAGKELVEGAAGAYQDLQGWIGRMDPRTLGAASVIAGPLLAPALLGGRLVIEGEKMLGVDIGDRSRGIPQQVIGATQGQEAGQQYAERRREGAEENPITATLANATGQIAATAPLLGGTFAAMGRGAAAKVGGTALEQTVAGGMVATGAEGALQGVLTVEDEARLAGKEGAAWEQLAAGGLLGGVVGLGTGGIVSSGGALFKRVFGRRAAEAADAAAEQAARREIAASTGGPQSLNATMAAAVRDEPGALGGVRGFVENANVAMGADRAAVRELGAMNRTPEAIAARETIRNAAKIKADTVDDIIEAVKTVENGVKTARQHTAAGLKLEEIAGTAHGDTLQRARIMYGGWQKAAQEFKAELAVDFSKDPKVARNVGKVIDQLSDFGERRLAKAANGEEAVIALDELKRELGAKAQTVADSIGAVGNPQQRDALKKLHQWIIGDAGKHQDAYGAIRTFLENPQMVGQVAAGRQTARNSAWHGMLEFEPEYHQALVSDSKHANAITAFRESGVDANKVAATVERIGRFRTDDVISAISNRLEKADALFEAELGNSTLSQVERKALEDARTAALSARERIAQRIKDVAVINKAESLKKAESTGGVLQGMIGPAIGVGIGTLGGIPGMILGGAGGQLLSSVLTRPYSTAMVADPVMALAGKLFKGMTGDVSQMTGLGRAVRGTVRAVAGTTAAAGKTAKAAMRVAPSAAARAFIGNYKTLDRAYEKRIEQVHQASDPLTIADKMAEFAPGLRDAKHVAGTAAQIQRAVDYLIDKQPAGTWVPSVFGPSKPSVSKAEMLQYARIWGAVIDPRTVFIDAARGTITPEQTEALKAVYPESYELLRTKAINDILSANGTHKYTLAERQLLSSVLDLPDTTIPGMNLAVAEMVMVSRRLVGERAQGRPPLNPNTGPKSTPSLFDPEQPWSK